MLWLPSSKCNNSGSKCEGATQTFDARKSKSYKQEKPANTVKVQYGSGTLQGTVGTDVLSFGNNQATVKQQAFGLATRIEADLLSDSINGIIGFAPGGGTADYNDSKDDHFTY